MADKARDLQFRVLSDLSKLDVDKAARDLEELGDAGKRSLSSLDDGIDTARRSLGEYADDARTAARKIGQAFDDIKREAKSSSRSVDGDTDEMKGSLREVGEEAGDTGKEMLASFSGSLDDITGAVQELGANAGALFGPVGLALGGALSVGVALFTKAKDELKQKVSEITDALIEGAGKIEEESIIAKLREFAQDGTLGKIRDEAERAGVSADLYARALAGDADAAEVLNARIREQIGALRDKSGVDGRAITQTDAQAKSLSVVAYNLSKTTGATDAARKQWEVYRDATAQGIIASVRLDIPSPKELDAINRQVRSGIGEIPVTLRVVGQSKFANTTNNSRDRY
jgi:hypothetical protein